jgi:hypothetical protein
MKQPEPRETQQAIAETFWQPVGFEWMSRMAITIAGKGLRENQRTLNKRKTLALKSNSGIL